MDGTNWNYRKYLIFYQYGGTPFLCEGIHPNVTTNKYDWCNHSFLHKQLLLCWSFMDREKQEWWIVNSLIDQTIFASWLQDPDEEIGNGLIDNV
mgnify:CR=1 FL=1